MESECLMEKYNEQEAIRHLKFDYVKTIDKMVLVGRCTGSDYDMYYVNVIKQPQELTDRIWELRPSMSHEFNNIAIVNQAGLWALRYDPN
jgi:hypothetical protein